MFKIKGGYELELQTHEITKLSEHKQINRQNKKIEKMYRVLEWLE